MKKLLLSVLVIVTVSFAKAEDGHRLWLRYNPVHTALVEAPAGSPTISIAQGELEKYYQGSHVILRLDPSMPDNEGFVMNGTS